MSELKNIAIFGGTFDPIHLGHLMVAEQVYNNYSIEQIIFMPAGLPPHKMNKRLTSPENRLMMVDLAIEDNDHFISSDYELQKEGKSYTAETLMFFLEEGIADNISFIIGADSLLDIFNWRKPYFLLENASFIVAARPGYNLDLFFSDEKYKPYHDSIYIMDTIQNDISSTRIRNMVKSGKSIKYQTSDQVIKYINKNKLYRG